MDIVNFVIIHRQISDLFSITFNLYFTKHKSYLYNCIAIWVRFLLDINKLKLIIMILI
jgi:hypothetical protein